MIKRVCSSVSGHSPIYVLSVIMGVEWPRASCTRLTLAPLWINTVAK
jgi:hypothetical protein